MANSDLTPLPKLPRANRPADKPCACGCGQWPKGHRSRFVPGHDARLHSVMKRLREARSTLEELMEWNAGHTQAALDEFERLGETIPTAEPTDNADA